MNSKYEVKKLGDYIVQVRGISYKPTDISEEPIDTHMAVLRANSIKNNKLILEDLIYVNKDLVKENQIIKENDILIAASSGSKEIVGKSVQIKDNTNFTFGAFCKIVRCSEKIEPRYVGYFLRTPYYRSTISNLVCGANINNLKNEHIDELLIPMPSREIQQKIVNILDKSQELIDKRKEQIEALDELVKSKFIEMFGDPALNPMEWNVVELSSLLVGKASNGFFAKNDEYKVNGNSKVMWLGDIINRRYSNTEGLKVVDVTEIQLKKYKVGYGDLLFCRSSLNKEGIGKASAVPKDVEDNIMFECHIIRTPLDLTKCIPEFIQVQSEMGYFRNQIITQSKTSTMTTIGQEGILKTKVILPNIELQKKFVKFIYQTDKLKSEMENSLKELEDNFNSLMQRAFKGELFN